MDRVMEKQKSYQDTAPSTPSSYPFHNSGESLLQHFRSVPSMFESILEHAPDGIARVDRNNRYLYVNRWMEVNFGIPRSVFLGRTPFEIGFPVHLCELWLSNITQVFTSGTPTESEFLIALPSGDRHHWFRFVPEFDHQNHVKSVLIFVCDITERKYQEQENQLQAKALQATLKALNDELKVLSLTDALTGLPNRRAFDARLTEEVERAKRYKAPLSLLLVDVDHFKSFNDTFGHPAGDEVLKTVAQLLQKRTRMSDFVARYGGEEFAIILPNATRSDAYVLAERFRRAIAQATWSQRTITISIGAFTAVGNETSETALLTDADRMLYQAKAQGRNRVVVNSQSTF